MLRIMYWSSFIIQTLNLQSSNLNSGMNCAWYELRIGLRIPSNLVINLRWTWFSAFPILSISLHAKKKFPHFQRRWWCASFIQNRNREHILTNERNSTFTIRFVSNVLGSKGSSPNAFPSLPPSSSPLELLKEGTHTQHVVVFTT